MGPADPPPSSVSPSLSMASLHVAQCCPRPWLTLSAERRDVARSVDKPSPQSPLLRLSDLTAAGEHKKSFVRAS